MHKNKRQLQAAKTRKRIYEVSMALFKEHGFNKVTINNICSACGFSTGAFYHYFKNKEDILIEQYRKTDSGLVKPVEDITGNTCIEKIIEYMCTYSDKAESDGLETVTEVCHAWLSLRLGFPYNIESEIFRGLGTLLNSAYLAGEIPSELNSKDFALDILMIVRGVIYHWCLMRGSFSLRQKSKEILGAYFSGAITSLFP